jgi:hypothetical protein
MSQLYGLRLNETLPLRSFEGGQYYFVLYVKNKFLNISMNKLLNISMNKLLNIM